MLISDQLKKIVRSRSRGSPCSEKLGFKNAKLLIGKDGRGYSPGGGALCPPGSAAQPPRELQPGHSVKARIQHLQDVPHCSPRRHLSHPFLLFFLFFLFLYAAIKRMPGLGRGGSAKCSSLSAGQLTGKEKQTRWGGGGDSSFQVL